MTRLASAVAVWLASAGLASAQTQTPTPTPAPAAAPSSSAPSRPRGDYTIGGLWNNASSFGSRGATELGADGQPFTLFNTASRQANGGGVQVEIDLPLFWRLRTEISGSWARTNLLIDVSNDFEGAGNATLKQPLTQVSTEGGVLLPFKRSAKREFFVRGGVGWIRQLTTDHVLVSDGVIGDVGFGMKYWWSQRRSVIRPMGLRFDFRAVARSGGQIFGQGAVEIGGSFTAGVIFGFWGG
jgi:hypothetical protein